MNPTIGIAGGELAEVLVVCRQGRDQHAGPAESLKLRRYPGSFRAWRCDAHVDELEAEAANPLQQSVQGALI